METKLYTIADIRKAFPFIRNQTVNHRIHGRLVVPRTTIGQAYVFTFSEVVHCGVVEALSNIGAIHFPGDFIETIRKSNPEPYDRDVLSCREYYRFKIGSEGRHRQFYEKFDYRIVIFLYIKWERVPRRKIYHIHYIPEKFIGPEDGTFEDMTTVAVGQVKVRAIYEMADKALRANVRETERR